MSGTNSTTPGLTPWTQFGWASNAATGSAANIVDGAQLGYGPNLPEIDGATPLTLNPIVIIVTRAPTMFQNVNNAEEVLKALIERHAKEVTGIDFGYTLEGAAQPVGQDGQEMHIPTTSKRTSVTPSFVFPEVLGNLAWDFFRNWIFMIRDPDTQASILASITTDSSLQPQEFSSFTMDIMCIQYDSTMHPDNIIDAYMIVNMWPQETGMGGWKRQIGHVEAPDRTISFYGIVQHNQNTKVAGQAIATTLALHTVNYDFATPVAQAIDPTVADMGLEQATAEAAADYTPLNT